MKNITTIRRILIGMFSHDKTKAQQTYGFPLTMDKSTSFIFHLSIPTILRVSSIIF